MLKIPFHSCDNGYMLFSDNINPFFYFYDKQTLGVKKQKGDNFLIFQNKVFVFKSFKFKKIDLIDSEIAKTLKFNKNSIGHFCYPEQEHILFKIFVCSNNSCSCTAQIIENDKGEVQLKYDYSLNTNVNINISNSFEHFWNVEFKRNRNKYVVLAGSVNSNILAFMQDNFIKNARFFNWEFGVVPFFRLTEDVKGGDFSFILRTDAEMGFILFSSNFSFEQGTINYKVTKNVVFSFMFNLFYIKERDVELYKNLKEIDKDANHILIFTNRKGSKVRIVLEYPTISKGIKKIGFYKYKNFFNFIC